MYRLATSSNRDTAISDITHHITRVSCYRLESDVVPGAIAGATIEIGRRNGIAYERLASFRDVVPRDNCQLAQYGASSS